MADDWFHYANGDVRMKSISGFNSKNNIYVDTRENPKLRNFLAIWSPIEFDTLSK